ncbi:hypothetical protein E0K83_03755 [Gramella sp. BOM4]|nr:hypothetical protein [Christiangramia bathymodioli]
MKTLPPEKELQQIDASLKTGERTALWLSFAALCVVLGMIITVSHHNPINKESPKRELQASLHNH